ncbi:prolyl oligopeptidase family serine peptidase [Virgibacillus sp. AGTR]|uniref:alpha/beta hydrolase family protein n=1 Tax=Virgibacillus sp. AGTR TaxID=2812055 RepID=UPI001D161CF8|nr:YqiA/YcfP family alpha/beta fold hydrolase [Virgibacillus sp. AGTR]MCC2252144.1 prolyl oligopeptidase family serine peptidase [Virgibacillus sp. AGTR]
MLLYYGWSSSIQENIFFAHVLSKFGYQVYIPELPFHGERGKPGSEEVGKWEAIYTSIQESRHIVDHIKKIPSVDTDNLGLIGISMGGYISSHIFVHEKSFRTLININGSSAWQKSERIANLFSGNTKDKYETFIKESDPINFIKDMYPRSILLLHGKEDKVVPVYSQRAFYQKASEYYADKNNKVELKEFPKLNHALSLGMMEEVIEWLNLNVSSEK